MKNTTTTARDARALDPWAFPLPRQEYDVRKLVGDFETVGKAKAEHDLRVRHLRTAGSIEHQRLADKLDSCAPKARFLRAEGPVPLGRLPYLLPTLPYVDHRGGPGTPRWNP